MLVLLFKTILAFLVLSIAGATLIGMIIRSFALTFFASVDNATNESVIDKMIRQNKISSGISLVISIALTIGSLILLNNKFSFYLVIAAIILMICRIPDVIHELKTGEKFSLKKMPRSAFQIILSIIPWLTIPLIWYGLKI